jgi:type II secretory pathway component GspD/PulD (secretin)
MCARNLLAGATMVVLLIGTVTTGAESKSRRKRQTQPVEARIEEPKLVVVAYPVADLVVPIDMEPGTGNRGEQTTVEDKLMRTITRSIAPRSWREGEGTIQYYPLGMALIVTQTPAVQEEIQALLTALRRTQDCNVAIEFKLVEVPDAVCERFFGAHKVAEGKCRSGEPVSFLTDQQLHALLHEAQGDSRTWIMQAPKVTVFNGQRAPVNVTDNEGFMVGCSIECPETGVVLSPKQEIITTGLSCTMRPVVSADGRSVQMELQAKHTKLDRTTPTVPVKVMVPQSTDTEPLTVVLQRPRVTTVELERSFKIADGQTAMFHAGKRLVETRTEYGPPPALSRIPYVNRLFRNVGYGREAMSVIVLVTPRVIIQPEAEVSQRRLEHQSGVLPAGTFTPDLAIPRR